MKLTNSLSSTLIIAGFFAVAIVGTVLIVMQIQSQQDVRSRADEPSVTWQTSQSAVTSCPAQGSGAIITVSFSNTEPNQSSNAMTVKVKDQQSGESVTLGNVTGGQTKTGKIETGRQTLTAGTVTFTLSWTDGHSGTDSRTASYKAVSNCQPTPTPTLTPKPSATPTPKVSPTPTVTPKPTIPGTTPSPTPTICPTLEPVKNVHIDCPNCPK
jgi:hypothetical protein